MTAALIFRRQLVRHSPLYLQQAPRASKLPLEKFHRLLNLAFWVKFLKLHTIPYFIFFLGVAELRYDQTTVPGSSGRIAFKSEYLNDYLNMEWERPKI